MGVANGSVPNSRPQRCFGARPQARGRPRRWRPHLSPQGEPKVCKAKVPCPIDLHPVQRIRETAVRCAGQKAPKSTGQQLLAAVAVVLDVHCARANALDRGKNLDVHGPFSEVEPASSSIQEFLTQIRKELRSSKECLILALVYLDRACEADPALQIRRLTVRRLVLTAILLASKFQDDNGHDNSHYARVGGMTVSELNRLEKHFLQSIGWRLHVDAADYAWYSELVRLAAPCN